MYLEDNRAPAFTPNPLGTAVGVVCAAVLVLMFVGFNPLTKLTRRYSDFQDVAAAQGAAPDAPAPVPAAPTASAR
jgi:hypothetical protein